MDIPHNCDKLFFSMVKGLDVPQFPAADPLTRLVFSAEQETLNAMARLSKNEGREEFTISALNLLETGAAFSNMRVEAARRHQTVIARSKEDGQPVEDFPFERIADPPTFARAIGSRILSYRGGFIAAGILDIASHPYHHEAVYRFAIKNRCTPSAAVNNLIQRGDVVYGFLSAGNFMTIGNDSEAVLAHGEYSEQIKPLLSNL